MLSVVYTEFSFMLSVVMANVVAPFWGLKNVRNLSSPTFGRVYVKKHHGILSTFISASVYRNSFYNHFVAPPILSRVTDCCAA
jgi:hypothetical protein